MHYLLEDATWVVVGISSEMFGQPEYLIDMDAMGRRYAAELAEYPYERYEELDRHYAALRGLAALDLWLLHDLLTYGAQVHQAGAAWLAALSPHPLYRQPLLEAKTHGPLARRLFEFAVAAIDDDEAGGQGESFARLRSIRASLDPLPRPQVPLRLAPSPEQIAQLQREQQRIGEIYRRAGAQAAHDAIPGTAQGYYGLTYAQWRRQDCPSLETYMAASARG